MTTYQKATFAGGCFWCMVKPFDEWDGVKQVVSGYTGGHFEHPTYEQVKRDTTGHYEAVEITYNPHIISYEDIIHIYWQQIDPTDDGGQFHDRGLSYRTAIFYHNDEQRKIAEQTKNHLVKSNKFTKPIVTQIIPAETFYPAEEYHQDFYKKDPEVYDKDRAESGRDQFIEAVWGKK